MALIFGVGAGDAAHHVILVAAVSFSWAIAATLAWLHIPMGVDIATLALCAINLLVTK